MTLLATTFFVLLLVTAAACDLRVRRIPNAVTVTGCLAGLALRVPGGMEALGDGALGLLVALGISAPLFAAGGLGGGDVKLLAAVGAFLGLSGLIPALLAVVVAGGVLAIGVAAYRGALRETFGHTMNLVKRLFRIRGGAARRTLSTPDALTIPYGVAIAIGGLYGWFGHAAGL